jgi:predicted transcriptional regulator with HTH domain
VRSLHVLKLVKKILKFKLSFGKCNFLFQAHRRNVVLKSEVASSALPSRRVTNEVGFIKLGLVGVLERYDGYSWHHYEANNISDL